MTLEINPRAFADWIRTGDGHPPLIGGKWFRYGPDQHGTNFHDLSPGRHTRRRADVGVYADGRWFVVLSHGPDQGLRSGVADDCVQALNVALAMRADWLAGASCGEPGCMYCSLDELQRNPHTDLPHHRRWYCRLAADDVKVIRG